MGLASGFCSCDARCESIKLHVHLHMNVFLWLYGCMHARFLCACVNV